MCRKVHKSRTHVGANLEAVLLKMGFVRMAHPHKLY